MLANLGKLKQLQVRLIYLHTWLTIMEYSNIDTYISNFIFFGLNSKEYVTPACVVFVLHTYDIDKTHLRSLNLFWCYQVKIHIIKLNCDNIPEGVMVCFLHYSQYNVHYIAKK